MAEAKYIFAIGSDVLRLNNVHSLYLRHVSSRSMHTSISRLCGLHSTSLLSSSCSSWKVASFLQKSYVDAVRSFDANLPKFASPPCCYRSSNAPGALCSTSPAHVNTTVRFSSTQAGAVVNSKDRKRFYKHVTVTKAGNNEYQINLDRIQLRTPLGTPFRVPTEPLALCVAAEWDAQRKYIKHHTMHLTKLCNTAIDNPVHLDKASMVDKLLGYLDNDTLCYRCEEPEALKKRQDELWNPIIYAVESAHKVEIGWSSDLAGPTISLGTKETFRRFFASYNFWALLGIIQMVESLKSVVVAVALLDRLVSVEDAVKLASLESEYQTEFWGRIEWSHDVDALELNSLVSSAVLFVVFNSEKVELISMPLTL